MATMYDVDTEELIEKTVEELKKIDSIKSPEWALFVKTGAHKERPPVKSDWWYVRAASILRTIYKRGPIGVSKLRTKYGGKKNRGHKPEEFRRAGGNILRKILQQLEKAGFAKQVEKGVHKGRIITPKGKSILDKAATAVRKAGKPKTAELKKEDKEVPEKKEAKAVIKKDEIKTQEKTKLAFEKKPTAEELIEETKKEGKKPEKVPTAAELAARKK